MSTRIKEALLMSNGNLMVTDYEGKQISELQGTYSIETHKRIMLLADNETKFVGFNIIPESFSHVVNEFVLFWNKKGWSYQNYLETVNDVL